VINIPRQSDAETGMRSALIVAKTSLFICGMLTFARARKSEPSLRPSPTW
jgi:hypothetical protein